jgi:hypothetical protein
MGDDDKAPAQRRPYRARKRRRLADLKRWRSALGTRCGHPSCPGHVEALELHHCVYAQHVRAAGGDLFDPRNALTIGRDCHGSHHQRVYVIPLTALPDAALEFAVELLGRPAAYEYLRRRYSGRDERLERVLHEGLPYPMVNEREL